MSVVKCKRCNGTGKVNIGVSTAKQTCPACNGAGVQRV